MARTETQTWAASNDMGEWEAWLKAGTGDDKTDIVVIADFYQRTGGLFSRTATFPATGILFRLEDSTFAVATNLAGYKVFG